MKRATEAGGWVSFDKDLRMPTPNTGTTEQWMHLMDALSTECVNATSRELPSLLPDGPRGHADAAWSMEVIALSTASMMLCATGGKSLGREVADAIARHLAARVEDWTRDALSKAEKREAPTWTPNPSTR